MKCENSNENSPMNATVQNVLNMFGELNPTASIKCEICLHKSKGLRESEEFKTVTEIAKHKWKYEDGFPNTVPFLGLPPVHLLLIPRHCLL